MYFEIASIALLYLVIAAPVFFRRDKDIEEAVEDKCPANAAETITLIKENILRDVQDDVITSNEGLELLKFDYLYAYPEHEEEIEEIFSVLKSKEG